MNLLDQFLVVLGDAIDKAGSASRLSEVLDCTPNLITRWKNRERVPRLSSVQPFLDYVGAEVRIIRAGEASDMDQLSRMLDDLRRENERLVTENTMQRGEIVALERLMSRLAPALASAPNEKSGGPNLRHIGSAASSDSGTSSLMAKARTA